MLKDIDPETIHTIINIILWFLLAIIGIVVLRGVFKVAWKIIRILLLIFGMLVVVGYLTGIIHISFF